LFFFQAEDGIRDLYVTGVQTCALPISSDVLQGEKRYIPPGSTSEVVMSLPARERRRLSGIQASLNRSDPQLASLFTTFARLNSRSEERRVGKEWSTRGWEKH